MKKISEKLDFTPVFRAYAKGRSLVFGGEFAVLNALSAMLPGNHDHLKRPSKETIQVAERELNLLFKRDSENIRKGIYPASVLVPESLLTHLRRIPKIMLDGLSLYWRRKSGKTTVFSDHAKEILKDLPRYYQRNFHYQSDGYLSSQSAEIYEHQVEMLFGGTADAMRRLIIAPMRATLGSTDGQGLTILEVAAGTGRTSSFVRQAFPKAKIVVTDLSEPYLKEAQKKLSKFSRLDFVQADGAHLPFKDATFDAVYSVFLYHELPLEARREVIAEAKRVLKPNGFFGLVDSLQKGQVPEFEPLLERFPKDFHEPFYRNYIENPIEDLVREAKIKEVKIDRGFFSKVCWGHK